jgi:hypothetical protein
MDWLEKVFAYCERGSDPGFWAEPANALSNAAFLLVAAIAARRLAPTGGRAAYPDAAPYLVGLVFVIGLGSFLFHTFADRWSGLADVVPIVVFMLAYAALVLFGVMRLPAPVAATCLALFLGAVALAMQVRCGPGIVDFTFRTDGSRCLNGSMMYVPALAILALAGLWLAARGHPMARSLLVGAAVFAVSLVARTLDQPWCELLVVGGYRLGSHFLWHLANAALLYVLLAGYIRHGRHWHPPRR